MAGGGCLSEEDMMKVRADLGMVFRKALVRSLTVAETWATSVRRD